MPLSVSRMLLLVFGILLSVLLLGEAAPTSDKQAHHIPLSTVRLPEGARGQWPSQTKRLHPSFQEKTSGGNVGLIYNSSFYAIMGTVSVGSPAQSVQVWVNLNDPDFIFLDAYGPDSSSDSTTDAKAGRYDYTASTTAVATNQSFYASYGSDTGNTTVTDTIQFNSLSVSGLTFGIANSYSDWVTQMNVGGIIGLSPSSSFYDTNLTSFGAQLTTSTSVDTPVVSLSLVLSSVNINTSINAYDMVTSGQVTVGAEDGTACTTGGYTYVNNTGGGASYSPYSSSFRVDSISGTTPSGDSLSLTVLADRQTVITEMFPGLSGSNDFIQLLVNASGLVDQGNGYYEAASCDDVQNMGSLTLNLAGGSTLTLSPADYIFQNVTSDGTTRCGTFMFSYGMDETVSGAASIPIQLGQTFLNNHCYAHNYADGTIGIARTVTQTTAVISAQ